MRKVAALAGVLLSFVHVSACSKEEAPAPSDVPEACAGAVVDRFKSLAVVDDAVVDDARSLNAAGGPWSFRWVVEQITPPGMSTSEFVYGWVQSWLGPGKVNLFNVEARPAAKTKLLCPWLRATPANNCDEACNTCAGTELDMAKAPFRFMGVAYRGDLRETSHPGTNGEGRFVFAMTTGPGDDPASPPMLGTVIFEFELPSDDGSGPRAWAERWRALSDFATFDEGYRSALEGITRGFATRGAKAAGVGGSSINQVRVNEREFEWQWDLREYKLQPGGLELAPVFRSPDLSVYESPELIRWVAANEEGILKAQYETPPSLTGGSSQPVQKLRLSSIREPVRKAFARETCAGCHNLEEPSLDFNFHYSPTRRGVAKLSKHLHDPANLEGDELGLRTKSMKRALCEP